MTQVLEKIDSDLWLKRIVWLSLFYFSPVLSLYLLAAFFLLRENHEEKSSLLWVYPVVGGLILASTPIDGGGDRQAYFYTFNEIYFATSLKHLFNVVSRNTGAVDMVFWIPGWVISKLFPNNSFAFFWIMPLAGLAFLNLGYLKLTNFRASIAANVILISGPTFYYIFGNTMRQSFALGLMVLALAFLAKQKRMIGNVIFFLALGSHSSMALALPLVLYLNFFSSRRRVKFFAILALISFIFGLFLGDTFFDFLHTIFNTLNVSKHFLNKIQVYSSQISTIPTGFIFIRAFPIIGIWLWLDRKHPHLIEGTSLIFCFFLYFFSIQAFFMKFDIFYNRYSSFRLVFEYILLAQVALNFRHRLKQPLIAVVLIGLLSFNIFLLETKFQTRLHGLGWKVLFTPISKIIINTWHN